MTRTLGHTPDRADRALRQMPTAWSRRRPRLAAALRTLIENAFQPLENEIFALAMAWDLRRMEGWVLEDVGAWVGERKEGLTTQEFRAIVRGKFRARRSSGSEPDVLETWAELTQARHVEINPVEHMGFVLVAYRDEYMRPEYAKRAAKVMRESSPMGAVVLFEALYANYLGLDRDTAPAASPFGIGIPCRTH